MGEGRASCRDAATGLPGRVGLVRVRGAGAALARARELNGRLTDGEAIAVISVGECRKEVLGDSAARLNVHFIVGAMCLCLNGNSY